VRGIGVDVNLGLFRASVGGGLAFGGSFGLADPQQTGKIRPGDIATILWASRKPSDLLNLINARIFLAVTFAINFEVWPSHLVPSASSHIELGK
jgi:hypothetical protein